MDIAARIGGEEFCVLAPEQDAANILKLGERLNAAVAEEVATPTSRRSASRSAR